MAIYQPKPRLETNKMFLSRYTRQYEPSAILEFDRPSFIYPEELRGNLLTIINKIEKFRFFGLPAAMGGCLTLRDKGNSCFDALPLGPMRLWYSAIIKFANGNAAACDWIEFYTAILSYYRMWLDVYSYRNGTLSVLNPTLLFRELEYIKNNKVTSGRYLATRARNVILNIKAVQLRYGDWSGDQAVINRVNQWNDKRNWCRCEKRFHL